MPQVDGLQATLDEMSDGGRLDQVPSAVVELAKGLARELDNPGEKDTGRAALWREYRAAVAALLEAASGTSDDDTTSFLVSIQTPGRAKVVDT